MPCFIIEIEALILPCLQLFFQRCIRLGESVSPTTAVAASGLLRLRDGGSPIFVKYFNTQPKVFSKFNRRLKQFTRRHERPALSNDSCSSNIVCHSSCVSPQLSRFKRTHNERLPLSEADSTHSASFQTMPPFWRTW